MLESARMNLTIIWLLQEKMEMWRVEASIILLQEHVFCWIDGTAVKSWGFLR